MEVRIKDTNGYVDADWTIEDGVMIVSPKEEKFEPKDGDIVVSSLDWIHILKNPTTSYISLDRFGFLDLSLTSCIRVARPATEEEKQKLFAKLAEEGWEWNSDKKELVKIKWKPKDGETFHFPIFSDELGEFVTDYQENDNTIIPSIVRGWCFKTEAECQAFCDRLNEATNQVKP